MSIPDEPRKRLKPKKPEKNRTIPMPPGKQFLPDISNTQAALIGLTVVEWSKLENALEDLLWSLTGLTFGDGRTITGRMDANTKITLLQRIAPRYLEDPHLRTIEEALVLADFIRDDRNFIMHGNWGTMLPDRIPVAMSLRAKSEPDEVTIESFSYERMQEIVLRIKAAKQTILDVIVALGSSPYKSDLPNSRG